MSRDLPRMGTVWGTISLVLGAVAFTGRRWAYATFAVMGLLSLPLRNGFSGTLRSCQVAFTPAEAASALGNVPHMFLFGIFFLMSLAQVRGKGWRGYGFAFAATFVMGLLLEVAQAISRRGNCELHDVIPDLAGALAAGALVYLGRQAAARSRQAATGKRQTENGKQNTENR